MREKKFRAWDKERQEMVYFEPLKISFTNGFWERKPFENYLISAGRALDGTQVGYNHSDFNQSIDPEDIETLEYTGLKDKNGVEIYEGDMLKHGRICTYDVIYTPPRFHAVDDDDEVLPIHEWKDSEVIGNIYENLELLK